MKTYSDNYNRCLLAEIYDQTVAYSDDVKLIRSLLKDLGQEQLSVLECFSGTGRILIPLLQDGHNLTGIEIAPAMAERAQMRAEEFKLSSRLTLKIQDALGASWGKEEYDVVIIGANALFELPSREMQQDIIKRAHEALKPEGWFFMDNDNWTTPLEERVGDRWVSLEGVGSDGTYARQSVETVAAEAGLLHNRRTWFTRTVDGVEYSEEYMTSKRPVSGLEVSQWVRETGFAVTQAFGNFTGSQFSPDSPRAIFWARKR